MAETFDRAFPFIALNPRPPKPRTRGVTEIRGPYYAAFGARHLEDVFETMHPYIDGLKFAGGSFALMNRTVVKSITALAHRYGVYVSTGGWIERILPRGPKAVEQYLAEAKDLGFDMVELSVGFISLPADDLVRLVKRAIREGLKAKPELGIQFGAGGATPTAELAAEGTRGARWIVSRARACLDAGAHVIMIESEGITENVTEWRTDVVDEVMDALGLERTMFEAAEPEVFSWYVKTYGAEVNLFVDHSQVVQLECLRSGIWGEKSTWGRVLTYKGV
jgi:phosphosulfolactate synthase (CoM biosynthesis protein A)